MKFPIMLGHGEREGRPQTVEFDIVFVDDPHEGVSGNSMTISHHLKSCMLSVWCPSKLISQKLDAVEGSLNRKYTTDGFVWSELGLDPTQASVFRFDQIDGFSYDRLIILLTNIIMDAGETYEVRGPYVDVIRGTFEAATPGSWKC